MTIRAEVQEVIARIENGARDFSALAHAVHRVAKSASDEERRALHNAARVARETVAREQAAMLAEVAS